MRIVPKFPKQAGTIKEFREWDEYLAREYPIRYKIDKFLEKAYRHLIQFPCWRLRDAKWWILHRIHPKHRYHVHKAKSLEPNYYDVDTLILHHSFDLFADFMDRQLSDDARVKWTGFEEDVAAGYMTEEEATLREDLWKEMNVLHHWWTQVRPLRDEQIELLYPLEDVDHKFGPLTVLDDDFRDSPEGQRRQEVFQKRNAQEEKWIEEDTENLIRLIKIRRSLWD